MTQVTDYSRENLEKAQELKRVVEQWVAETFNFINLSVMERIARNPDTTDYASELVEHIRQEPVENVVEEYLYNLDENELNELKQEAKEDIFINPETETLSEEEFKQYLVDNRESEIREWYEENQSIENYPIWNTVFEFKSEPGEKLISIAQEVGLGVIDSFDEFNTSLFMTSCGHSFYSSYWIPLYLKFYGEFSKELKEKYANVDFSMM